ncbi:MAG: nicotinate-nucleotide--dimethylbenzimidazole phosphoribosyltransferase [Litorimonas sp.]
MTDRGPLDDETIQSAIDGKTKPVGSLGRLESLAAQLCRIQGTLQPTAQTCRLTVFAADHGMARAGVSAFPQDVTRQMVLNFLAGGAASNVFCASVGASMQVVDAGVAGDPIVHAALLDRRIGDGTRDALQGPAMTEEELQRALSAGEAIGATMTEDVAAFGEMGIGNTSSASLLCAKILGEPVEGFVGRGTGLDDPGLERKRALLARAAARTADRLDPADALQDYGGFEIAMMAGAMIGAARAGRVVVVDGFIATASALCAQRIDPAVSGAFVHAHRSAEAAHGRVLDALGADPLLDLDLRLGEGTGAVLAFPLIRAAAAMMRDMASFVSAGVSGPA